MPYRHHPLRRFPYAVPLLWVRGPPPNRSTATTPTADERRGVSREPGGPHSRPPEALSITLSQEGVWGPQGTRNNAETPPTSSSAQTTSEPWCLFKWAGQEGTREKKMGHFNPALNLCPGTSAHMLHVPSQLRWEARWPPKLKMQTVTVNLNLTPIDLSSVLMGLLAIPAATPIVELSALSLRKPRPPPPLSHARL
ncbi:hypothetical protein SKAU_G00408780 [Synaphobranchus kaupii]|uniref:Uncharacterized protein n=1 Tax=Synaphobranchus kaupii TaxID=118154 RepID=A0A9Q1EAI7_SYNKA|nr:hypothetical protein SKAU_G00408780 [Synaphobranchus kaupii]